MRPLAATISRMIGLTTLVLLATSVPPSTRPATALPNRAAAKGNAQAPEKPHEKPAEQAPVIIISADLGTIWHAAGAARWVPPGGCGMGTGHGMILPGVTDLDRPEAIRQSWPGRAVRPVAAPIELVPCDRAQAPPV